MGNVRTPKTVYFEHGVVLFYVKNKEIFYSVRLWTNDGFTDFEYTRGKYESDNQIQELVKSTLQSFSSVGVIEN